MFDDRSSCELRLDLAEAEAEKPKTINGICRKKNRIRAITAELLARGSF